MPRVTGAADRVPDAHREVLIFLDKLLAPVTVESFTYSVERTNKNYNETLKGNRK